MQVVVVGVSLVLRSAWTAAPVSCHHLAVPEKVFMTSV